VKESIVANFASTPPLNNIVFHVLKGGGRWLS
jgi:hypothetical protein